YDIGEIYKIHGCIKNPNSILINSDDYKQIELKHKYIAAKLLTIFVEHPIFFLGYSLGDEDIRNILNDIQISLTPKQLKEIEDRLFYVVWDESQEHFSHSTYSINFDNGRSITIKQISLNDYSLLYNALSKNKSRYPVKMLRHVKEDMYNLVLTNDPTERMLLTIPDKELSKEDMEKIEFVYGFGMIERARNGYNIVSTEEIYKDAVFDTANLNPELFVKETLTYALQKSSGYIPIRKYTSQVEYSSLPKQVKDNLKRFNKIDDLLSQKLINYKRSLPVPPTFKDALKSPSKMIYDNLSIVSYNSNNIELLGDYLKKILD
ncbi:SIR2 family protein, partial [Enterococcus faecalis]|nr:SIR2 family protein [Enterococcus faecalis]